MDTVLDRRAGRSARMITEPRERSMDSTHATDRGHLLVFPYFFPPVGGGGVQRTTKFLKYLGRLGWTATVITAEPEYWIRDDSLVGDIPRGTRVERTRSATAYTVLQHVLGTKRSA